MIIQKFSQLWVKNGCLRGGQKGFFWRFGPICCPICPRLTWKPLKLIQNSGNCVKGHKYPPKWSTGGQKWLCEGDQNAFFGHFGHCFTNFGQDVPCKLLKLMQNPGKWVTWYKYQWMWSRGGGKWWVGRVNMQFVAFSANFFLLILAFLWLNLHYKTLC